MIPFEDNLPANAATRSCHLSYCAPPPAAAIERPPLVSKLLIPQEDEEDEEFQFMKNEDVAFLAYVGGLMVPQERAWIDTNTLTAILDVCNEDPEVFQILQRKDWPPPPGDAIHEAETLFGMIL